MKNFRNVDFVYWPITIKFRIRKKTSKPQTNYRCCLRFSYLAPYWLISRSKITFHRYFWCSRFCEFHSKCEFGEQEVWVVLTFFELGSSYHLTDTKTNDVKVLFLDFIISKLLTIAIICSLNVSLNRQRHHLLQLTSQLTTVRYVKRTFYQLSCSFTVYSWSRTVGQQKHSMNS